MRDLNVSTVKKLFCGNCMKTHKVEVNYQLKFGYISDPNLKGDCFIQFTYPCECGNEMYEIDSSMFDFIIRLNKLGYYTEYCCEGHYNNGIESYPYIKFTSPLESCRDDYTHWMGTYKELSFINFLKKNLDFPLHFYKQNSDRTIIIETDFNPLYDGLKDGETVTEDMFNAYKESSLKEFNRIITLLEEAEKKGR